jgi:stearoyl-CoA desaturase (delta-9 desaturase)
MGAEDLPTEGAPIALEPQEAAAPPSPWTMREKREVARFLGVHVAALLGVALTGLDGPTVALCLGLYAVRMFGVTAGYHRYFSHRSFKTSRAFAIFLAFLAESSAQRGVIWWARQHRHHHRFSDRDEDLHSPKRGFWWAHLGWIFAEDRWSTADIVRDLERDPALAWLDRHWLVPPVVVGALCLLLGGPQALFGGFLLSTMLLWHGTYTINSLSHVWGSRRFETEDTSRNNAVLALITLGEGWHNNHHHCMRSCRQGLAWYELDITYAVLKVLSWVGLVCDLRAPPPEVLRAAGRRA